MLAEIVLPQFFDPYIEEFKALGRVLVAALLGGVIGFEREIKDRPAGLRTHMLVAASACLLISLGKPLVAEFDGSQQGQDYMRIDPTRLIEAIIAGVAFLGAGTIIRPEGGGVKGLTTAASILVAAVIGIAVSLSQWVTACGVAVISVLLLVSFRLIAGKVGPKDEG